MHRAPHGLLTPGTHLNVNLKQYIKTKISECSFFIPLSIISLSTTTIKSLLTNSTLLIMHFLSTITALTGLMTMVLANSCNQDNCYRAIKRYETTSSAFCKQYLATP